MIRSRDVQYLLDAMLENQPWNEYQKGYYQCMSDLQSRLFTREIFRRWWQDPMFLLGIVAGAVGASVLIGALAMVIAA